jgi:RNA polymerase I-specific transcription initiation factor RRN3
MNTNGSLNWHANLDYCLHFTSISGTIPLEHRSALLPSSVNRRLIYSRLHSLLRSILRLIPTLPSTLSPLLDLYFPKKREHRDGHICYLSNILKIASYCPDLRPKIVQLCVEKCLKIDVEIQVEVEEWEDDEGRLEAEIFGKSIEDALDRSWMDEDAQDSDVDEEEDADSEEVNFDDLSSDDGNLSEDEKDKISTVASPQSIRKVKKLAAKLDGMLRCIFDHLQQICFGASLPSPTSATTDTTTFTTTSPPPPPTITSPTTTTTTPSPVTEDTTDATKEQPIIPPVDPQRDFDRDAIFDHLLTNFESAILRTRRTRHVQFIIFWYASMQPRFTNLLLATLVERGLYETEDNSLPVATRVAAVSYIASLISRAKYIDKDMTRYVVSLLCARLQMGMNEPKKMNVNGHVVWYAIAQAIFYIFCFRWKDLLVEDDDDEPGTAGMGECEGLTIHLTQPKKFNERWLSGLKILERAIVSPFNPLKVSHIHSAPESECVLHQSGLPRSLFLFFLFSFS